MRGVASENEWSIESPFDEISLESWVSSGCGRRDQKLSFAVSTEERQRILDFSVQFDVTADQTSIFSKKPGQSWYEFVRRKVRCGFLKIRFGRFDRKQLPSHIVAAEWRHLLERHQGNINLSLFLVEGVSL